MMMRLTAFHQIEMCACDKLDMLNKINEALFSLSERFQRNG